MFRKTAISAGAALSLTMMPLFSGPALGHHSFAMFDQTQTLSVTGTVTRFDWLNPHAWLYVAAMDENGNEMAWGFETSGLRNLASTGWTSDSVKAGDRVVVGFHPLRDGTNGGQLRTVVLPDGTELCSGRECRARYGVTE